MNRGQILAMRIYRRRMMECKMFISRHSFFFLTIFERSNEAKTLKYIYAIRSPYLSVYLFSQDMKVRHRPVLYSGRLQVERHVCAVLQYLLCHCACPSAKKTTLAMIGCNAADSGK